MPYYSIDELRRIIAPIASAHGVKSVSVFGSYSRGNATANSDVDLKIEKGHLHSLFQLSGFRLAVEDALRLPVDLVTSDTSDPDFLEMIRKEEVCFIETCDAVILFKLSCSVSESQIIWSDITTIIPHLKTATSSRTHVACVSFNLVN